ncbi:MAG TPA: aspartyl-phosphate phosphatase Spo0E family protein [Bacillota bacterium]|jgi:hypothetical protein|nr:aspartyl-phosphate phosphatase Spo0E family protein [Bacillota bacterium]HOL10414.1 aspartyl-phosphate phosphatase Spo0E family protein [Bacillota bacterium]HPO96771.1 aspartyl-phosphate phosphatase Spo0E family protein [Bacillota bacterium]
MTTKQQQFQMANLEAKITDARKNLHSLWETKGYTDDEVLDASIKLDQLLNQYQRLISKR